MGSTARAFAIGVWEHFSGLQYDSILAALKRRVDSQEVRETIGRGLCRGCSSDFSPGQCLYESRQGFPGRHLHGCGCARRQPAFEEFAYRFNCPLISCIGLGFLGVLWAGALKVNGPSLLQNHFLVGLVNIAGAIRAFPRRQRVIIKGPCRNVEDAPDVPDPLVIDTLVKSISIDSCHCHTGTLEPR